MQKNLEDMSVADLARDVLGFWENKRWCEEFRVNHPNCFGCAYELPCAKLAQLGIVMVEYSGGARKRDEAAILMFKIAEARSLQEIHNIMSSAPEADWPMVDWLIDDEGDDF